MTRHRGCGMEMLTFVTLDTAVILKRFEPWHSGQIAQGLLLHLTMKRFACGTAEQGVILPPSIVTLAKSMPQNPHQTAQRSP